jgi:hypothetical protein
VAKETTASPVAGTCDTRLKVMADAESRDNAASARSDSDTAAGTSSASARNAAYEAARPARVLWSSAHHCRNTRKLRSSSWITDLHRAYAGFSSSGRCDGDGDGGGGAGSDSGDVPCSSSS